MGEFFWVRFPNARLNTIRFSFELEFRIRFLKILLRGIARWAVATFATYCWLSNLRAPRISQANEAQTLAMLCQCFVIQTESFDLAWPSFYWFLATSKESGKSVCNMPDVH